MTLTVPLAHLASSKPTAAEASSRKTLNALALAVAKARRIVVVTGAGISCSSGIPDFRSSDGLYNLVKSRYPDAVLKGRDLFDAALFRDPTSSALFYTFMAELKTQIDSAHPAPVHDFLATLDAKGKLLRSYTQNIDGLEERAGLGTGECNPVGGAPRPKNVQLHGDIHRVRCTLCSASYPCAPDHIEQFRTGTPPDCPECTARSDARTARSARALKCGTLRPAIVLYDEPHPLGDHIGAVQTSDLGKKPDLLIVMGTSLKVHGLRRLVKSFAKAVHSSRPSTTTTTGSTSRSLLHNVVFVNRTPPPPDWTGILDYHVQGDTDAWVAQVLNEWRRARPADWETQQTLEEIGIGRGIKGPGLGEADKVKGAKGAEVGKPGKKGNGATAVKPKGKGKSKAGLENTPPEDDASTHSGRLTIVLPRVANFKAGASKSPLKSRVPVSGIRKMGRNQVAKSSGLGVAKSGLGISSPAGRCQLGMSTPNRLGAVKAGVKRPAASPLTPRLRVELSIRRGSVSARKPAARGAIKDGGAFAVDSSAESSSSSSQSSNSSMPSSRDELESGPSGSEISLIPPFTNDSSTASSSTPSPCLEPSALSSQTDLMLLEAQELPENSRKSAPSSQASTSSSQASSQDSIFSRPSSQSTLASSQGDPASRSQSGLASASQSPLELCSQPSQASGSRHSSPKRPTERRSSQPRSPTCAYRGPGVESISSSDLLSFGFSRRTSSSGIGPHFGSQRQSSAGLPASRHQATIVPARRATTIPIPGRDFGILPLGEKLFGDSGGSALSSQVSLAPPPPPDPSLLSAKRFVGSIVSPGVTQHRNYWAEGSPRKRGRVSGDGEGCEVDGDGDEDEELNDTEDEDEARPGLLFGKGKGVATVDEDIIDLDPSDEEDVPTAPPDEEDSMSLDDAVGHMSLDGPVPLNSDVDIEGEGDTDEGGVSMLPLPTPTSPIQTRAKRRANKAASTVVKRGTGKRPPRVRVAGTRMSSRLASKTDVTMSS